MQPATQNLEVITVYVSVGERNTLQAVLMSWFYFLSAQLRDNTSNTVYVLGHKYILIPSQSSFQPSPNGLAKVSLSQVQSIFMPVSINSFILLHLRSWQLIKVA